MTLCGVLDPRGGPDVTGEPGAGELGNGLVMAEVGATGGAGVRR